MKKYRSLVLKMIIASSVILGLSACGGSDSTPQDSSYEGTVIIAEPGDSNMTVSLNNHGVITKVQSAPNSNNQYIETIYTLDSTDKVIANTWKIKEVSSDSVVEELDYELKFNYDSDDKITSIVRQDRDSLTNFNYTYNENKQITELNVSTSSNSDGDIYTYIYDTNATDAKLIRSTYDRDNDGINGIYDYNYTSTGYLAQYTEDSNVDGIVDQVRKYFYDANNNLIRVEKDYNNDGNADYNSTLVYTDSKIARYDDDEFRVETIYSDATAKAFLQTLFFEPDHQSLLNIEYIKISSRLSDG